MSRVHFTIWYDVDSKAAYDCIKSIVNSTVLHDVHINAVRTSASTGTAFDSKIRWLPRTTLFHMPKGSIGDVFYKSYNQAKRNNQENKWDYFAFGIANFTVVNSKFLDGLVNANRFYVPIQSHEMIDHTRSHALRKCDNLFLLFLPNLYETSMTPALKYSVSNYYILESMTDKLGLMGFMGFKAAHSTCKVNHTIVQHTIVQEATYKDDRVLYSRANSKKYEDYVNINVINKLS